MLSKLASLASSFTRAFTSASKPLLAQSTISSSGSHVILFVPQSVLSSVLLSAAIVVGINTAGYIITAVSRTHKITDLVGTGSFVASAVGTFVVGQTKSGSIVDQGLRSLLSSSTTLSLGSTILAARPIIMTVAASVWGCRLAGYLFTRICKTGTDERLKTFFPENESTPWTVKSLLWLSVFWTIQAAWGWIVMLPVSVMNGIPPAVHHSWALQHGKGVSLGIFGLSTLTWMSGFVFEVVADAQKKTFKSKQENKDKFIQTGLYSLCRFPNYFGEISLWWGMYGMGFPFLQNAYWWTIASPLLTMYLLTKLSGIPLLEKNQEKRYGKDPNFQDYKARTNRLIPSIPKSDPKGQDL